MDLRAVVNELFPKGMDPFELARGSFRKATAERDGSRILAEGEAQASWVGSMYLAGEMVVTALELKLGLVEPSPAEAAAIQEAAEFAVNLSKRDVSEFKTEGELTAILVPAAIEVVDKLQELLEKAWAADEAQNGDPQ